MAIRTATGHPHVLMNQTYDGGLPLRARPLPVIVGVVDVDEPADLMSTQRCVGEINPADSADGVTVEEHDVFVGARPLAETGVRIDAHATHPSSRTRRTAYSSSVSH